ncbi:prolipoprotein diacylglyceryl transferase [Subsaximicrobium wynnwilliamsii]|uniref:Phosphatidylglycerol--prolipoprotein diacylglyceryl transferase n=1 Tax=Subsaximicrobium wynnwilliamsii TaxID=291179 RepID=A0A5C6ZJP1_9FLAO|nr:prolipoprotein diacylglyceryl transferase [Subsaximicrobium wynnwilliamsii]TXD84358.1 prolipoprotein diacylglyceryl transferase [Subsaximicrobium wynnwilliamsii]TXD90039.1 prolipoprotein diacylglyceryl transferase [Subsaximicrobium wynnwilliamsii]TXE04091.1 prolipoprotein diacylglyceryl transferase [Subsaximicrobium wynnwilliamsii]
MFALEIVWDPSKGLDLGFFMLHYYSVMWIVAFLLGLNIMKRIYKHEGQSEKSLDSLFIYSVVGIMLGARLGHVIFYQPELFTEDFFSIFLPVKFKGGFEFTGFQGLASHGAAIAMIISMYLYNKKVLHKTVLWILDRVVIPVASGAVFVRLGNFINSEIIGKPTGSDFGVVFKQLGETFPRHPAQLYEAFSYVFVFLALMYFYWKTKKSEQEGFLFGLFLVLLWTVRFFVEFMKEPQGDEYFILMGFNTGQLLSIPFILIGLYFMFVYKSKRSDVEKTRS